MANQKNGRFFSRKNCDVLYLGLSPLPVRVTTRIITFLVGNPYKPSFPLLLGGGTTQAIPFLGGFPGPGIKAPWPSEMTTMAAAVALIDLGRFVGFLLGGLGEFFGGYSIFFL